MQSKKSIKVNRREVMAIMCVKNSISKTETNSTKLKLILIVL